MNPPTLERKISQAVSTELLRGKLKGVRVRAILEIVTRRASGVLIVLIGLLAMALIADWVFEFGRSARMGVLGVFLASLISATIYHLIRPLMKAPDVEGAALIVEAKFSECSSQLISALQLEKAPVGNEFHNQFVAATIQQANKRVENLPLKQAVPFKRMWQWFGAAGLAAILFISWCVLKQPIAAPLIARFLLQEVELPKKTRIVSISGDLRVGLGDPIIIKATVEGVVPEVGSLILVTKNGSRREVSFDRVPDTKNFERSMETVSEDFSYQVILNDARSKTFEVKVQDRPMLSTVTVELQNPDYTGLASQKVGLLDLNPLQGSVLNFSFRSSKPLASASARLSGDPKEIAAKVDSSNPRQGRISIPIQSTNINGISLHLVDLEKMPSTNSPVYQIRVRPDFPPAIVIRYPDRREELLTRAGQLSVVYEVRDDFGLAEAGFNYRVVHGSGTKTKAFSKDLELQKNARSATNRFSFLLSSFPNLKEGDTVEYWIRAKDNNVVSGPGLGESEIYSVKIVSAEEKKRDLMHRVSDSLGILNDLTSEQEKLNENLGTVLRPKTNAE
jgi:hypothetical protein